MARKRIKIDRIKTAGVIFPPPFIYLFSIIAGVIANKLWRIRIFPNAAALAVASGTILILIAISIFVGSLKILKRAKTPIRPDKPTLKIVKTGPYKFSRNPVYVSFAFTQIGIAILLNNLWILIGLIPAIFLIHYGVISREEKYLEEKFGKEYIKYKNSVRRWI